jgi:hypothetical protein
VEDSHGGNSSMLACEGGEVGASHVWPRFSLCSRFTSMRPKQPESVSS